MTSAKGEEGHHHRGEEDPNLRLQHLVSEKLSAFEGSGEEELDLRFTEHEAGLLARQSPGTEDDQDGQETDDGAEQVIHRARGHRRRADPHVTPPEECPQIEPRQHRSRQIPRLTQSHDPADNAVFQPASDQKRCRADHDAAVMRRNASSSETSPRPCAICHFSSSIVP